jgi:hypothetical protein
MIDYRFHLRRFVYGLIPFVGLAALGVSIVLLSYLVGPAIVFGFILFLGMLLLIYIIGSILTIEIEIGERYKD